MSAPPASQPNRSAKAAQTPGAGAILAELESLAARTDRTDQRCGLLFERLRKAQGTPRLAALLAGMEVHFRRGGPAAARLLAAYLEVATHAERLFPHVRNLGSSRRYLYRLRSDRRDANAFARDWLERLKVASEALPGGADRDREAALRPGSEYPWPQARSWLEDTLAGLTQDSCYPAEPVQDVVRWLRLELDALEERASCLAGSVNPFRIETVQRMLPLLSGLDGTIRDGRRWLAQLAEGGLEQALRTPFSRSLERMEEGEFQALLRAISEVGAHRLADLLRRRIECARPAADLADDILRLQLLGQALAREGCPGHWTDLLSAAGTAVGPGGPEGPEGLRVEVAPEIVDRVDTLLLESKEPDPELEGVHVDRNSGWLVLPRRASPGKKRDWPHGLAVVTAGRIDASAQWQVKPTADDESGEPAETGAAATRRLVTSSMQTMSILLALLRNPKVTSIPGLVSEVATRTRNPQVIATIATDRALYTGFANRDVPLACLWNPSNVSVKVLRKFIHVKHVSKLDLMRLSQDRAGVRRELRHEIDRYLETLA